MGNGQPQPLEGGTISAEKPEDKLANKANDSLQGDVAKQGFEGLNSQVNQQTQQEKLDRNLTLDQQLQKNGTVKIGIITRDFNCSVEITGTDPKTGKPIEYVRGRSPDEVARAKEAEAQPPDQKRAGQEQAYKDKFGEDADKPLGAPQPQQLTDPQLDEIASYLAKNPPKEKPVLVAYGNDTASDVAPTPGQVYKDAQNDQMPGVGWTPLESSSLEKIKVGNQEYNTDQVTAQDWGALIKKGFDRVGQAAQNPELREGENPPEGGDPKYPHRGREDKFIDFDASSKANKAFPELAKYIGDGPGKVDPDLIAATIRNEQFYYVNVKDTGPDHYIRTHGNWSFNQDESIGPAQIQVQNINHLANEYPKQLGTKADAVKNAEDIHNAPYFVGAYFADVIHGIETKHKPDYISPNTWESINRHWQKGERNEALIIAYNPDPNQINHVFSQLDNIKAPDWD